MEFLAARRASTETRATYDTNWHANLINSFKSSQLYEALQDVLTSVPQSNFASVPCVIDAVKTLKYATTIYNLWLSDAWSSVFYQVIDIGTGCGSWSPENGWGPFSDYYQTEFEWICSHSQKIDAYAEQGTQPARHVIHNFVEMKEDEEMKYSRRRDDSKILRNLHRFMDAVSLYAYWTTMRAYEMWGEKLLRQRLQVALLDDRYCVEYLGSLSNAPKACLREIANNL